MTAAAQFKHTPKEANDRFKRMLVDDYRRILRHSRETIYTYSALPRVRSFLLNVAVAAVCAIISVVTLTISAFPPPQPPPSLPAGPVLIVQAPTRAEMDQEVRSREFMDLQIIQRLDRVQSAYEGMQVRYNETDKKVDALNLKLTGILFVGVAIFGEMLHRVFNKLFGKE